MLIYIDSEFKCHIADDGNMAAVETDFFDGKCPAFIESYRYVPAGQVWIRPDGTAFEGEMIAPCKDYSLAEAFQMQYEEDQEEMLDMRTALETLGVRLDG